MRVRRHILGWVVMVGMALATPWCGWAQTMARPAAFAGVDAAGMPVTVEAALRTMITQAAVMFVGTVVEVRRVGGDGFASAEGVVEVRFSVERGIRGVEGGTYLLREWGGLWAANGPRYTVGSRLLMLLHAPSAAGLSSPVGGMDGAIALKGSGALVAAEDGTVAENAPVADLRWLQAKLARQVESQARASRPFPMMRAMAVGGTTAAQGVAAADRASTPVAQASVETVLAMMAAWAKEAGDGR